MTGRHYHWVVDNYLLVKMTSYGGPWASLCLPHKLTVLVVYLCTPYLCMFNSYKSNYVLMVMIPKLKNQASFRFTYVILNSSVLGEILLETFNWESVFVQSLYTLHNQLLLGTFVNGLAHVQLYYTFKMQVLLCL